MTDLRYKRIAVKIGSNVLTRADGTLNITRMSALVDQVALLHREGAEVVLISSGAVASGRSTLRVDRRMDVVDQRQLFSAVGQAKLINHYYDLFREQGIVVGQVLTTKENFADRRHYLNQRNCMRVMLDNGVIPIVNENDAVSVSELMFTDNDELSGLIASMMDMEALVILSNIDGIFNGPPADPRSPVIRELRPADDVSAFIQAGKSTFGRGGMHTKTAILVDWTGHRAVQTAFHSRDRAEKLDAEATEVLVPPASPAPAVVVSRGLSPAARAAQRSPPAPDARHQDGRVA